MRVRLGEATMVPDDFRSADTIGFSASLDGLRKHFLDIARVFDTTDIDFRCHGIRGAEMDATDTAKALIEVLLERDVPDAVQLNLILAQVEAATLDDKFGLGQSVLREGQGQRKDGVAFSVSPENFRTSNFSRVAPLLSMDFCFIERTYRRPQPLIEAHSPQTLRFGRPDRTVRMWL